MRQNQSLLLLLLVPAISVYTNATLYDTYDINEDICDPFVAGPEFKKKICTNPYPEFTESPYKTMTPELDQLIHETNANKDLVCSI